MSDFSIDEDAPARGEARAHVAAPRSLVWDVLSDLERWPFWNPAVGRMQLRGPVIAGVRFDWSAGGLPVRSVLQQVEPERVIAWTGRSPGLVARHLWLLESEGGGTLVTTRESFSGWLARLMPGPMSGAIRRALEQGLRALADESERRAARAGFSA